VIVRWSRSFAVSCALSAVSTVAAAQATRSYASHPVAPSTATTVDAAYRSALGQMRTDLRNLIAAQDTYQGQHGAYATDIAQLAAFQPMTGIDARIVHARANGWAAVETYATGTDAERSCTIWVGGIASEERPATNAEHKVYPEAEVACDGDAIRQRDEWAAAAQSYMTFALRKLVRSEEKYLALNGHYTTDVSALEPFLWDRGVTVTVVAAGEAGWAAKASYEMFPGKSCVLWRGTVETGALGLKADHDQVVCDEL
jgi:hypothetical protein